MVYDACLQRGKQDRTLKLQKTSFYRNSVYEAVKRRCQEVTWPHGEDGATYYVADGSGISIEREKLRLLGKMGKKAL